MWSFLLFCVHELWLYYAVVSLIFEGITFQGHSKKNNVWRIHELVAIDVLIKCSMTMYKREYLISISSINSSIKATEIGILSTKPQYGIWYISSWLTKRRLQRRLELTSPWFPERWRKRTQCYRIRQREQFRGWQTSVW